ncbi:hypothetical protein UAW_03061 [Enterococcus haemoperoxidus ATCC BAA-382]|uniref:Uncharacterized protein n=1 Tax=Enterococcus haemoperoxidus ATCC BAA-382 TaxID=1158608 RepID=R2SHR1_9ENTE|nr:hypothetical protein [Enterococcus haemoperoxidus]EOH92396.1 hypothetical protein UAW_03061 [Enterococcus haemoperoxidus ATCC BAA-382]EOT61762.1 hypothetical protein I583_00744 [Enterococcus haemoperoxidus ATCC BAA-382]OJG53965.1 hypothetical protein RV06_GL000584 [Enterococcus haemoperoxidus]
MNKRNWYFADNGKGQEEGFSSQGLTEFKRDHFTHVARENCQNSIDAKSKRNNGPIVIKFSVVEVLSNEIPGIDNLITHLNECASYSENDDEENFFKKAIKHLTRNKVRVLKISDYGTTGLEGIGVPKSSWNALVNSIGKSKKGKGSGGSYGLGKNAPFVVSEANTVFYSTLNEEKEYGFQGVSKLMSHEHNGITTRATGYYYCNDSHRPIQDPKEIPNIFRRSEVGTDIFSVAFVNGNSWKKSIIKSTIENFFVAIERGELEVYVDETVISKESLDGLVVKYFPKIGKTLVNFYQYYDAYLNGNKYLINILDKGTVELYLKQGENYNRKVAMFRSTGMKIKEQSRLPKEISYAGVLITRNDDVNEILRKMEPPTHTDWSVDFLYDKTQIKESKKVLDEIISQIKAIINELVSKNIDESIILTLDGLLPDLNDQELLNINKSNQVVPNKNRVNYSSVEDPNELKIKKKSNIGKKLAKNKKVKERNNSTKRKSKVNNRSNEKQDRYTNLDFKKVRSFSNDDTKDYTLILETSNTGKGLFEISLIGKGNKVYKETIVSVQDKNNNEIIEIKDTNIIGPIYFIKGQSRVLSVKIPGYSNYSLGVEAYEI